MSRLTTGRVARFVSDERGSYTIWAIAWFMLFVGLGGLAIDSTNGFRVKTILQATADAAAHAAAQDLPDEALATNAALDYAEKNMPAASHGSVLAAGDIEFGTWDVPSRTFTPGTTPKNGVRVTVRSTADNGNPIPLSFLRIVGLANWDIVATATAAHEPPVNCYENGFIAAGGVFSGSEDNYVDRLCIHGQQGVTVGSTNFFEYDSELGEGVEVTMLDHETMLVAGSDNTNIDDVTADKDLLPPLVPELPDIVSGLIDGSNVPPGFIIDASVSVPSLPTNWCSNSTQDPTTCLMHHRLYIVTSDDAVLDSNLGNDIRNIDVIAAAPGKKVVLGSQLTIANALFASVGDINFGSENQIGASDFCNSGGGEVYIFAEGLFDGGSQSDYSGVQIVAGGDAKIGSELNSLKGIAVQAGGDIFWGSQNTFGGCNAKTLFLQPDTIALVE